MEPLFGDADRTQVVALTSAGEAGALIENFEAIAREEGWQPGDALRAHGEEALHLGVTVEGKLVGGLQAVLGGGGRPLPYVAVWPEVEVAEPARTLHVTMMALRAEYRGNPRLFWPLCVELWRWCVREGVETILLETTPPTLRVYRRLGWPLEVVGGLRPHWGEPCYLCRNSVRQVAEALTARAARSDIYKALVQQGRRDTAMGEDVPTPVDATGAALP